MMINLYYSLSSSKGNALKPVGSNVHEFKLCNKMCILFQNVTSLILKEKLAYPFHVMTHK